MEVQIAMSLSPPTIPPYIFLMSDHTTRQLAVDVAEALSAKYPSVYVDDFLAPVHEGFAAMFELDWKRDMGNPKVTTEQFSVQAGGQTENDIIVSLEKWFIDEFGDKMLGHFARQRSDARNVMADYITVFRDATPKHLEGFGALRPIDCVEIDLKHYSTVDEVLHTLEG